jgi:hypothetical protein
VVSEVPAATVDPHCVRVGGVHGFNVVSPSGRVAGNPAFVQSIALLEERMPDQGCCAWAKKENESDVPRRRDKQNREYLKLGLLQKAISTGGRTKSLAAVGYDRALRT